MRVATETRLIEVEPGSTAEVVVEVTNTGNVIDGVSARVIGLSEAGVTTEPAMLPLFPDSAGHLSLSLAVPPAHPAGPHPLTVEIVSHGAQLPSQYVDLELAVAARPALRMAAKPREVRARRSGRFLLELTNDGNVPLDVKVRGLEVDRASTLRFKPDTVRVPAGAVVPVVLQVRGPRMLTGGDVDRAVTVEAVATRADAVALDEVQPAPLPPQVSTVHLRQRPLLSRGLLTALVLAAIVALWALVFLLGMMQVFSGDPMTKSAPPSFFPASATTDGGSGAGSGGGAGGAAGAPAGALQKSGQLPAGVGASFAGTVISETEGQPVGRILVEAIRVGDDQVETVSSAATLADGTYTLAGLFPGDYYLRFSAEGYETVWYPSSPSQAGAELVEADPQETYTGLDAIVTGLPASISGAISSGDPLASVVATVTARPLESTSSSGPVARTRTTPEGAYTLENLPAPARYQLSFTAPGYGTTTLVETVNGGDDRLVPTVRLGASDGFISGLVTDGTSPLGGATVTTTVGGEEISVLTPTAGREGTFVLDDLPTPATYVLTFSAPGHGTQRRIIELGAGKTRRDFTVALATGTGSLSGRVTDGSGRPLGGVTVTIGGLSAGEAPATTTLTDGDVGAFVFNGLPAPGSYTATFTLEGYAPATIPIDLSASGALSELEVELSDKLGRITGQVLGPQGNPYVGATVVATDGRQAWETKSTGAGGALPAGSFLLTGLEPGSYSLTVRADGLQQQTALVRVVAGRPGTRTLRLED